MTKRGRRTTTSPVTVPAGASTGLTHPALGPEGAAADPRTAVGRVPRSVMLEAALLSQSAPPTSPEPPRTYRLESTRRGLLSLLAVALAVLAFTLSFWFTTQPVGSSVNLLDALVLVSVTLLLVTAAVAMQRATRRIRIVLSDEEVTYHGFASTVHVPWQHIAGIRVGGRGIFRGIGLVLDGPAEVAAPRILTRLGLAANDRFVPLAPFAEPSRGSALELDLRHRVPRAFGADSGRISGAHL